jgi:hypothetical protein
MSLHAALAAAATLLATAFAFSTLERWLARHKKHELMWTISLAMFALASLALWSGAALGWSEWSFKAFYLFGAILNVPFLALGTVYLLLGERVGDRCTALVSLLAAFAAGMVVSTSTIDTGLTDALPQGSVVFGAGPRVAAAVGSGVAAVVVVAGAVISVVRLVRRPSPEPTDRPAAGPNDRSAAGPNDRSAAGPNDRSAAGPGAGRMVTANILIAVGTIVLGAGGALNSVADAMDAFAISLAAGIGLIFAGFLVTFTPTTADAPATTRTTSLPTPSVEPWYPPEPRDAAEARAHLN